MSTTTPRILDARLRRMVLAARDELIAYARYCGGPHRSLLSTDELESIAHLAIAEAALRYDPERGASFVTFARFAVRGRILNALRKELSRLHRQGEPVAVTLPPFQVTAETRLIAGQMLEGLPERDLVVYCDHKAFGTRRAQLAREAGRHRAWAGRRIAEVERVLDQRRKAA